MKLCYPADFENKTLKSFEQLNKEFKGDCVYEVYGSAPTDLLGGGRNQEILPSVTDEYLSEYIQECHQRKIKFNYVYNISCLGSNENNHKYIDHYLSYIQHLRDLGVYSITLAIPYLIDITHNHFPDLPIIASILCQINSPKKADFYLNLGVRRLTLSEDINRCFDLINSIQYNEIEVIVNSTCLYNCPTREFHRNSTSHLKEPNPWFYQCRSSFIDNPVEILKSQGIVRPEDIELWERVGVFYFKLAGREMPKLYKEYDFVRSAKSYLCRSYHGNLLDLLLHFSKTGFNTLYIDNSMLNGFLDHWVDNKAPCSKVKYCTDTDCSYCETFFKNSILKNFNPDYYWNVKNIMDKTYKNNSRSKDSISLKQLFSKRKL